MEHSIQTHTLMPPFKDTSRKVRVVLPKSYESVHDKHYPVLYMHDGQNVLVDEESFSGHSWRALENLSLKGMPEIILVAIDNDGNNRLNEYVPWTYDKYGGLGDAYAKWLVEDLKPFIDHTYRTLKDKKHTGVAGSSLGGLISAYIGAKYPDVFGILGVFSLASWVKEDEFLKYIKEHPLYEDSFVYIQTGTHEGHDIELDEKSSVLNQTYIDNTIRYYETLISNHHPISKLSFHIYYGETHHEKYWAKHFGEFILRAYQ